MLGIIDPIFKKKKNIYVTFGYEDYFASLIWRYLAYLTEIIILMGKRFSANCVVIFALFF